MQNTEIKMLQVPFKPIQTQDHYSLSNCCGIPRLKMERSPSFKLIFDACHTNTLFFCFGTLTQITSMNTGVAFKLFYNETRYRSPSVLQH